MTVEAYDRAQQNKIAAGSVLALDNVIDSTTGTLRIKSIFTNEDNALFPSQFVNVKLLIDTLHDKTLIPTSAVQRNAQDSFVYVFKPDQTVEMRSIKTDVTDGDTTAVEGLSPGEIIVTDNFNRLQNGAKVAERTAGGGRPGGNPE
jgi:multidrug efflux system membrane fusion protein